MNATFAANHPGRAALATQRQQMFAQDPQDGAALNAIHQQALAEAQGNNNGGHLTRAQYQQIQAEQNQLDQTTISPEAAQGGGGDQGGGNPFAAALGQSFGGGDQGGGGGGDWASTHPAREALLQERQQIRANNPGAGAALAAIHQEVVADAQADNNDGHLNADQIAQIRAQENALAA